MVSVLATARNMGARLPRTLIVGCEPEQLDGGLMLSATVQQAVEPAVQKILTIVRDELRRTELPDEGGAG